MRIINMKNHLPAYWLVFVALNFFACSSVKTVSKVLIVNVSNPSTTNRVAETVEVSWKQLQKLGSLNEKQIVIKAKETGVEIPSQVIYGGSSTPKSVIFQTDIKANASQQFLVTSGTPSKYPTKVYGRQVPERFSDFAWENDKAAFRMYGAALEGTKGMAKGIDFWAKRTSRLIINEWYKSGNYHKDNGDGVDAYHVGITLGAGDAAPIVGENIIYPINYAAYKILENGPIRIAFQLTYKPFLVNGKSVKLVKTISLDAGSQMNMISHKYESDGRLNIAVGVTKHKDDGVGKLDQQNNFLAYWDQADGGKGNGFMGVGVVYPIKGFKEIKETKQHILAIVDSSKAGEITYYQGGGWSKSGNFESDKNWFNYLSNFNANLKSPLTIKIN